MKVTSVTVLPVVAGGKLEVSVKSAVQVERPMLQLRPATWIDYRRFVNLCCVNTLPFHGGRCWTVEGDIAFIGYNFCYWNNHQRNLIWPERLLAGRHFDLQWLNDNVRCLNRVMVRPEHRGEGIATRLVRQTLPLVGVPYVECLTFAELIRGILLRCGFEMYGKASKNTCFYYLWSSQNSGKIQGKKGNHTLK